MPGYCEAWKCEGWDTFKPNSLKLRTPKGTLHSQTDSHVLGSLHVYGSWTLGRSIEDAVALTLHHVLNFLDLKEPNYVRLFLLVIIVPLLTRFLLSSCMINWWIHWSSADHFVTGFWTFYCFGSRESKVEIACWKSLWLILVRHRNVSFPRCYSHYVHLIAWRRFRTAWLWSSLIIQSALALSAILSWTI